jgi:hypothetical protein
MGVKRGHMVSEGYIKAWADKRNVVDVIDVQDRRGFSTSVHNATVVSYVYDPNVLTRDLEKAYSKIEDFGTPVIVKLREGESLADEEFDAMITFLDMHLDKASCPRACSENRRRGRGSRVEPWRCAVALPIAPRSAEAKDARARSMGMAGVARRGPRHRRRRRTAVGLINEGCRGLHSHVPSVPRPTARNRTTIAGRRSNE